MFVAPVTGFKYVPVALVSSSIALMVSVVYDRPPVLNESRPWSKRRAAMRKAPWSVPLVLRALTERLSKLSQIAPRSWSVTSMRST